MWRIIKGNSVLGNYKNIKQAQHRLHVIRLLGGDGFIKRVD